LPRGVFADTLRDLAVGGRLASIAGSSSVTIPFPHAAMHPGWSIDTDLERDWLYLRVTRAEPTNQGTERAETELADAMLEAARGRNCHRLIVEFNNGLLLNSMLAGQLVVLHKRVHLLGGSLRLCGLSEFNRDVLRLMGLLDRFSLYADRASAGQS
jgi:anti-anti-sigma regulatory factor